MAGVSERVFPAPTLACGCVCGADRVIGAGLDFALSSSSCIAFNRACNSFRLSSVTTTVRASTATFTSDLSPRARERALASCDSSATVSTPSAPLLAASVAVFAIMRSIAVDAASTNSLRDASSVSAIGCDLDEVDAGNERCGLPPFRSGSFQPPRVCPRFSCWYWRTNLRCFV